MTKVPIYIVRFWFVLQLVIGSGTALAQNSYQLIIHIPDKDSTPIKRSLHLKTVFQSRTECMEYIQKLPTLLQATGYLSASIDSLSDGLGYSVIKLFAGEVYDTVRLRIKEHDAPYLNAIGWKLTNGKGETLTFPKYLAKREKLLDYFGNTGYPFARLMLDSMAITKNRIEAALLIDRGVAYKVDSIRVYGKGKISKNFLYRYLGIEKGSIYRQDRLNKIDQRLLELPYIQQQRPWEVAMLNTGSIVNLYLQPKKSNQVNLLAGFLPSNAQIGGKLLFTVDANLQLQNAFGSGESVGLVWQQLQPKSPRLNLQARLPYIFNSPFGVDFLFDLYKKDSVYLNITSRLGLLYALSLNQTGKIFILNERTNVLDLDTVRVKVLKALPDIADVSSISIGGDYEFVNTDYRFSPRHGNQFALTARVGNKKIRKNTSVTQIKDPLFNYNSLYDTVKLNAFQFRLNMDAAHYMELGKQSVLKTSITGGWYESPNYFRNELFQIGGYKLLRGFDEQGIFASHYAVASVEYRYLFGLNSYFFGFIDGGTTKDKSKPYIRSKRYLGAGLGMAFESKGGIFNISFAAGKRNDLDFSLRETKIHLGYVSVF